MSSWPSSRSWERGTAVPLIKPRERPSLLMTRRSKHSRPSSSWFASSQRRAAGVSFNEKRAQRSARAAPVRTISPSARPPRHKPRASMAMDLPAPVSPVIAVIPLWKSISSSRTMAKLLMVSCASIIVFLYEKP